MARWFRGRFGCTITEWRKGVRPPAEIPVGVGRLRLSVPERARP